MIAGLRRGTRPGKTRSPVLRPPLPYFDRDSSVVEGQGNVAPTLSVPNR